VVESGRFGEFVFDFCHYEVHSRMESERLFSGRLNGYTGSARCVRQRSAIERRRMRTVGQEATFAVAARIVDNAHRGARAVSISSGPVADHS